MHRLLFILISLAKLAIVAQQKLIMLPGKRANSPLAIQAYWAYYRINPLFMSPAATPAMDLAARFRELGETRVILEIAP